MPADRREAGDDWLIDGSGQPPPWRHSVLPYAGYVVLRSGWDPDALCLAFDGGPFGASHQHEDKLSIQLSAHGTELIGEAGTVDYADSPQRRYCLSTLAHSTAMVDGHGQSRRIGFEQAHIPLDRPADLRHDLDAATAWAEADYDEGYGPDRIAVRHRRRVTLLADDLVEVRDEFDADDDRQHTVELLFHLLVPDAEIVAGGVRTTGAAGNCALATIDAAGSVIGGSLAVGDDGPDLRGWASPVAGGPEPDAYNLAPLPCWTVSHAFSGRASLVTRIAIAAAGTPAAIPDMSTADVLRPGREA